MGRGFEPFSDHVDRPIIPTGKWQRVVGILLNVFGLFPLMASTPFNGAAAVAMLCFSVGSSLLFWGLMLKYFAALEEKLGLLIVELGFQSQDSDPA